MKTARDPVACVTAYDFPFAQSAEHAGVDIILVGDSGGMVQLGYSTTNPVTMDEMMTMAISVRRGAPNTFVIGDMPQGSYEPSDRDAVTNAVRFVKEAGCDAVKLEGGRRITDRVRAIAHAGILVMGHLGLTPQSTAAHGGYRVQGKTLDNFAGIVKDALGLREAGAFALLLEAMPAAPAGQVARRVEFPVYGIGAGGEVDGQLTIMHDLMGFYQPFRPWFAKCYVPEVARRFVAHLETFDDIRTIGRTHRRDGLLVLAEMAIRTYVGDVRRRAFPGEEYSYTLTSSELAALRASEHWNSS